MTGKVKIHGKEYKTVALRVAEFRAAHPDYTIQTELIEANDVLVIMKATIAIGGVVISTGHAEEVRAASKINKTSALENAETSAVGRALAFFSSSLAGTEIASADELINALNQQNSQKMLVEETELAHKAAKNAIEVNQSLEAHNEALQRNFASVYFIKEHLALQSWEAVAEAWGEITNDDKKALWLAPSKGGIFTTAERKDLKSNEFNEARKLILGEA